MHIPILLIKVNVLLLIVSLIKSITELITTFCPVFSQILKNY